MSPAPPPSGLNKRRAARFAAVQALYQLDLGGGMPGAVVAEFEAHRLGELLAGGDEEDLPDPRVDVAFFRRLVLGTSAGRERLDVALEGSLAAGWTLARCGFSLRACLRAGAYELSDCVDVPIKVVINEYIEVTRLFLPDDEPGFVNAVLDRLAPQLRAAPAPA